MPMLRFLLCFLFFISPALAADKQRILVLGDSLTAGYGIDQAKAFPKILENLLNKSGNNVEVINAGSSGSTSASAIGRLKWHLRSKPKLLILALGANDGLRGIEVKSTKKNLAKAIDLAQENKIKVLLAGMKLPYNYGKKYRKDFEAVFQSLVKEKKIEFIPFLLKDVGGVKDLNLPDGIHPNEKGHQKIAKNILPKVQECLK